MNPNGRVLYISLLLRHGCSATIEGGVPPPTKMQKPRENAIFHVAQEILHIYHFPTTKMGLVLTLIKCESPLLGWGCGIIFIKP
jgi:hypothetical protein